MTPQEELENTIRKLRKVYEAARGRCLEGILFASFCQR
ncbi:hypothetical protein M2192_001223 [Bradyrhizobium elkanii USDA 61]|nr:hypothetical protein [Bradyrhizobium elkanii]MCS3479581.1 hypothetical protein [Bradyrhizobium elkanii]MCS3576969.1 hypothetical protein [Bradyrhizobium elkanii]MCS3719846.1 hypothetical protein [Bradyrhizobium elkanii]MCS4004263.1 hypothetical protein [Bradyrhizobium elkanii USDA 61]